MGSMRDLDDFETKSANRRQADFVYAYIYIYTSIIKKLCLVYIFIINLYFNYVLSLVLLYL